MTFANSVRCTFVRPVFLPRRLCFIEIIHDYKAFHSGLQNEGAVAFGRS